MGIEFKKTVYQAPDSDDDTYVRVKATVTNTQNVDIEYLKSTLVVCNKQGMPIISSNEEDEEFLSPSESTSLEMTTYFKAGLVGGKCSNANLLLSVTPHTCHYAELPEIRPADSPFTITGIHEKTNVDDVVIVDAVSIYYETDDYDDEDDKCCVQVKFLVTNLTDTHINRCIVVSRLLNKSGRQLEEDETREEIPPKSTVLIESSFWGIKSKRLHKSKIKPEIKIYLPLTPMIAQAKGLELEED